MLESVPMTPVATTRRVVRPRDQQCVIRGGAYFIPTGTITVRERVVAVVRLTMSSAGFARFGVSSSRTTRTRSGFEPSQS